MNSTSASGPRQRSQIWSTVTRPRRKGAMGSATRPTDRNFAGHDFRGLDLAALFGNRLEPHRPPKLTGADRQRGGSALADIKPTRCGDFDFKRGPATRQRPITHADEQRKESVVKRQCPKAGV